MAMSLIVVPISNIGVAIVIDNPTFPNAFIALPMTLIDIAALEILSAFSIFSIILPVPLKSITVCGYQFSQPAPFKVTERPFILITVIKFER
eukprot:CAMPEP_0115004302 /NCGR_PEP_ID=MMETSP0216-20121206/19115_1 /TAXON_ID=223996 /ORGANISM="Protocruzia adherens, Strain Boccale" /LENGTH=91 /DNA_ID=CAMNT_0002370251 /DNA_START=136 /DNA_END=407 /DNA_ORIENTATION=-